MKRVLREVGIILIFLLPVLAIQYVTEKAETDRENARRSFFSAWDRIDRSQNMAESKMQQECMKGDRHLVCSVQNGEVQISYFQSKASTHPFRIWKVQIRKGELYCQSGC